MNLFSIWLFNKVTWQQQWKTLSSSVLLDIVKMLRFFSKRYSSRRDKKSDRSKNNSSVKKSILKAPANQPGMVTSGATAKNVLISNEQLTASSSSSRPLEVWLQQDCVSIFTYVLEWRAFLKKALCSHFLIFGNYYIDLECYYYMGGVSYRPQITRIWHWYHH